jgi:uncharacterized membrane protein (UPF0127 family)
MNRSLFYGVVVACLMIGSCGGNDDGGEQRGQTATSPSPSATFDSATALIDTDEGSVLIDVEVAETERQRELGLMNRESLPKDAGMVFVFFEPTTGGFWMKNTLIPLSIAFFDVDGKILEILDMEPCTRDPCEVYDPGVTYMGALEVNKGAFDRWNVEEGDFIQLNR